MGKPTEIVLIAISLDAGHVKIDLENNEFRCSEGFLNIVEASTSSPLSRDEWISLFDESDQEYVSRCLDRAQDGETVEEELILSPEGDAEKYITLNLKPVFEEGAVSSVVGVIQNKGRDTQNDSQSTLEHITDTIPGVVYRLKVTPEKEQSFEFISGGCKQLLGLEAEAVLEDFNLVWDIIHPEDRKVMYRSLDDLIETRGSWKNEFRISTGDDSYKWILGKSDFDEVRPDGSMLWSGVLLDITNRKILEVELQRKNYLLEHAQELSSMGFWKWELEENTVEWSDQLYQIYGLDKATFESTFEGYLSLVHPDDRKDTKKVILNAINDKEDFSFEERIIRNDGEIRHLKTWGDTSLDENGDVDEMFGACMDTTELKRAEQKVRKSLNEKEILLHEIHHRVKNNLQLITGLIELQINNTEQKEIRQMLDESRLRIFSIAKVHEILFQNDSLVNIQFDQYLSELVNVIGSSAEVEDSNIELTVDFDETELNVNQAIPCGMILNELLVNACKHAFPDNRDGQVKISLKSSGDTVELSVEDNGSGIPEEIDPKNPDTLGFLLLKTLIDQLDGELKKFRRTPGALFTIAFEKKTLTGSSSNL